jgi:hypothetical protein
MDEDLRLAAREGFLLLRQPVPEGVRIAGRVLRYDPSLPTEVRARLIDRCLSGSRPLLA